MDAVKISFIVVNWNGGVMLAECLDSIDRQQIHDYEVIVVDNGSSDQSWDLPYFQRPGWYLERLPGNIGFSAANNLAYQRSRGEFIALVNNDVRLTPDWALLMVNALQNVSEAGSAACRLLQHDCPSKLDSAGFAWYASGTVTSWMGLSADYFSGQRHQPFGAVASAALYRRSVLEKVGLFRASFFAYYEDTDLAARMMLFGAPCVYVNNAVACHRGSITGGRSPQFKEYHLRRNIEYLYWTNMVGGLAFRHFLSHMVYEAFVFFKMMAFGRGNVFLRAKWDALAQWKWIVAERAALREKLVGAGDLHGAKQRISRNLNPWWKWFAGKWGGRVWRK